MDSAHMNEYTKYGHNLFESWTQLAWKSGLELNWKEERKSRMIDITNTPTYLYLQQTASGLSPK